MPAAKAKSMEELLERRKALQTEKDAEIAAIRKNHAQRIAALKADERRIRASDIRNMRKRENHAKILIGVAIIHQCQTSEMSASRFKTLLEQFYSDSPDRLKEAFWGLDLIVKKPSSDQEKD